MMPLFQRGSTLHNRHRWKESSQLDWSKEELITADTGERSGQSTVEIDMTLKNTEPLSRDGTKDGWNQD